MKKLYIVGNWKSNKSIAETLDWISSFKSSTIGTAEVENKEVVICPQFPLLYIFKNEFQDYKINEVLKLNIGSQNVSPYQEGAHTGEVTAKLLKEFCTYTIVGHSERRQQFSETDESIYQKIKLLLQNEITPILCVSDLEHFNSMKSIIQNDNNTVSLKNVVVAYEPIWAIGTGKTDTPENADSVCKSIKDAGAEFVIYGGSVNAENVNSFTSMPNINGVLPGNASLDPLKFIHIVKNS